MKQRIMSTAWEQIGQTGAATLSLRAIARQLDITAPAIYNYFPDRDALVTALIIEAYSSFGDSQIAARDSLPAEDLVGRMLATGTEYRRWALAHPRHYQLIFGTPIPGYVAPFEQVFPSASRSLGAIVSAVEALRVAGKLRLDASFPASTPGHEALFESWKSYAHEADLISLSVAALIWSRVHGLVSLEISGHLPPFGCSSDALYLYELDSIRRQFTSE